MYLTRFAKKVTIIHRRDKLRAQKIIQDSAFENTRNRIYLGYRCGEINGKDGKVSHLTIKNVKTGETGEFETDGVFVYIGTVPLSEPFKSLGIVDEEGYIPTNENMETKIPGIFAAGDIREKDLRQVVTATGDGSIAAERQQNILNNCR